MSACQSTRLLRQALLRPSPSSTLTAHQARRAFRTTTPVLDAAPAATDSTPRTPALLATLKQDLKTAMRAKDADRLGVLRAVISAANNAAKTSTPISTDAQLVALLRKNQRAGRDAAAQARDAARPDLAEKEEAQVRVLEEYINGSGVVRVTEAEVLEMVGRFVGEAKEAGAQGKEALGRVMKSVLEALKGRDVEVEVKKISDMVKQAVGK